MSEETRDEWAREWIAKLLVHQNTAADQLIQITRTIEKLAARIKALETARHNQPPN